MSEQASTLIQRGIDLFSTAHPELHVVMGTLKGSRLYQLPMQHSDTDVRIIYLAPEEDWLGLRDPQLNVNLTVEHPEWGVYDVVGFEAKKFFRHLSTSNGNFVETACAPHIVVNEDFGMDAQDWNALGGLFITRKLYDYYRGYAKGQLQRAGSQVRTDKALFYLYRELYAGLFVMYVGRIPYDWKMLRKWVEDGDDYKPRLFRSGVLSRLEKRGADREAADPELIKEAWEEFPELDAHLDIAYESSSLPASPHAADIDQLHQALLRLRRRVGARVEVS